MKERMYNLIEDRGYGIEYIEFSGTLMECRAHLQEIRRMQVEGDDYDNGDGYPYSYKIERA